jgi:cellulose synthase/poly-beta-1,6-N-acetylglucosamine synthase-like glycosyltransferase
MKLSVVIIGRNEGPRLQACIESVRAQAFPADEFEIVYVDSASSDGSPDTARHLGASVIELNGSPMSAARGRNAGWRTAKAAFILFLDGDTILDPNFAGRAISELERHPDWVAVLGRRRESHPRQSLFNRVLDIDWIREPGPQDFFGGDAVVRREALEAAGGYDEHLVAGEEPELCRRLRERGWIITYIDAPMTLHDLAMESWTQYWRRAVRTGLAYAQVSERFAATSDPLWSRERRHHLRGGLFWMMLPSAGIAASLFTAAIWPFALVLALLFTLCVRSAWRHRHRCPSVLTALLYGIHSQIQHVPILVGIWEYGRRKRTHRTGLIEYKRSPSQVEARPQ